MLSSCILPAGKWVGRKSMWAGFFAFIIWSGIEAYDGAKDRFHTRFTQAKETIVPPIEDRSDKVISGAEKVATSLADNPIPTLFTLAIFILTVLYHKYTGKSLKNALTTTVLRSESKPNVIIRAEQELLYQQLISTEMSLESAVSDLPKQVLHAESRLPGLLSAAKAAEEEARRKRALYEEVVTLRRTLADKLEVAKKDLRDVREQLGKADDAAI